MAVGQHQGHDRQLRPEQPHQPHVLAVAQERQRRRHQDEPADPRWMPKAGLEGDSPPERVPDQVGAADLQAVEERRQPAGEETGVVGADGFGGVAVPGQVRGDHAAGPGKAPEGGKERCVGGRQPVQEDHRPAPRRTGLQVRGLDSVRLGHAGRQVALGAV